MAAWRVMCIVVLSTQLTRQPQVSFSSSLPVRSEIRWANSQRAVNVEDPTRFGSFCWQWQNARRETIGFFTASLNCETLSHGCYDSMRNVLKTICLNTIIAVIYEQNFSCSFRCIHGCKSSAINDSLKNATPDIWARFRLCFQVMCFNLKIFVPSHRTTPKAAFTNRVLTISWP